MRGSDAVLVPKSEPDWLGAAEVLIEGCAHLRTPEARVRWLERLCLSLGDALYPAFLQVLCCVGEHGDAAAQRAVADTLVLALQTGRLPSGRHMAWGAMQGAATRTMGPVEYLCAWHAQPGKRGWLSAAAFDRAARAVLGLVSHSNTARRMYCAKLLADAEDPLGGAWSRGVRSALAAMARSWRAAEESALPEHIAAAAVDAFLAELRRGCNGDGPVQPTVAWIPPASLR